MGNTFIAAFHPADIPGSTLAILLSRRTHAEPSLLAALPREYGVIGCVCAAVADLGIGLATTAVSAGRSRRWFALSTSRRVLAHQARAQGAHHIGHIRERDIILALAGGDVAQQLLPQGQALGYRGRGLRAQGSPQHLQVVRTHFDATLLMAILVDPLCGALSAFNSI